MPSNVEVATRDTPPTLMSRSESEGSAPATKACAITTERVRGPRPARSERTRTMAASIAAWWDRAGSCQGSARARGSR